MPNSTDENQKKFKNFRAVADAGSVALGAGVAVEMQRQCDAAALGAAGVREVQRSNKTYAGASMAQRAGRAAEIHHATTLSADAALKGITVRAKTTTSAGNPGATGDLIAVNAGKVTAQAEVKYHRTAARSAVAVSDPKYAGQQLVLPRDQALRAKNLLLRSAAKKVSTNPAKALARSNAAADVCDSFKADGASSRPLDLLGARELVNDPTKLGTLFPQPTFRDAAKASAKSGLVTSALVSTVANGLAVAKGHKDFPDALGDVVVSTATGTVRAVVVSVGGRATASVMARAGFRGLAKGSAPVAVAAASLEVGADVLKFARGQIDAGQLAIRSGKTAARGAGAWASAEVGAVIGSFLMPGFGTIAGAFVGGFAGCIGMDRLLR